MIKVLIVDDNAISLRLCRDLLQGHGYETIEATDGPQALEVLHVTRPDMVLLDIQLPGMSGLEVARSIRGDSDLQSLPIAALTAFTIGGDREACLAAGCDDYLNKPFLLADLLDLVERCSAPPGTDVPASDATEPEAPLRN